METLVKNTQARWYTELTERFETLMEQLGIDEDTGSEIKIFLLQIARDQYMAGNRSGIRWARTQSAVPQTA
jgi:ribosome assembly protein YihI (activator of Der GTPase)